MANYVEGKDFEFREVKGKDGKVLYKNRHFFTKAEKEASKTPKAAPSVKAATKATTTKPKTKDAMAGYRKGDVTTSPIPSDIAKAAVAAVKSAPKPPSKPTAKQPARPVTPTRSKTATGRYSEYEKARLGNYTEAQWDAMTPVQREAKGLPVSWMDWVRVGGKESVKGYAKGGMVKKKGKK